MKEQAQISFVVGFLVLAGLAIFFLNNYQADFNFYKSELLIDGNQVAEKLYFAPDKPYHTLYRGFISPVYSINESPSILNYIEVNNVACSSGSAYARNNNARCTYFEGQISQDICIPYTENNEYGCGFGNTYGFKKGEEYWLESQYELHPENLFLIEGKYYIKFVIYSGKKHPRLNEANFIIAGEAVKDSKYSYNEQVIIYIPYSGETQNFNIISQDSFEFDKSFWKSFIKLVFCLFPAILFFWIWFFFGREKTYADIPSELSSYPNERKPWEVAAFFHPPFNVLDKEFFSTMLVDFYHRKIIDLKMNGKEIMIKIKDYPLDSLDKTETYFLSILNSLFTDDPSQSTSSGFLSGIFGKKSRTDYVEDGYLNLKDSMSSLINKNYLMKSFKTLRKDVKKIGKGYISETGTIILRVVLMASFYFWVVLLQNLSGLFVFFFIIGFFALGAILVLNSKSALFSRFKEDYYKEYQHWQAYRRFLKNSFSIKAHGYKGVILWDKILVYATALGVAEKVLEEMKKIGAIDDRTFMVYTGIYSNSTSFSTSIGSAGGHGGGFGGAGGGGVGGGGGGGR